MPLSSWTFGDVLDISNSNKRENPVFVFDNTILPPDSNGDGQGFIAAGGSTPIDLTAARIRYRDDADRGYRTGGIRVGVIATHVDSTYYLRGAIQHATKGGFYALKVRENTLGTVTLSLVAGQPHSLSESTFVFPIINPRTGLTGLGLYDRYYVEFEWTIGSTSRPVVELTGRIRLEADPDFTVICRACRDFSLFQAEVSAPSRYPWVGYGSTFSNTTEESLWSIAPDTWRSLTDPVFEDLSFGTGTVYVFDYQLLLPTGASSLVTIASETWEPPTLSMVLAGTHFEGWPDTDQDVTEHWESTPVASPEYRAITNYRVW